MDSLKGFSLKIKSNFFLVVAALCLFSVGAWWAVRLLVWSEVAARLVADADRVEATLKERLSAQANNLLNLRGQFLLYGVPKPQKFGAMVNAFDLLDRYPGSLGVGYAPVWRLSDSRESTLLQRGGNGFTAPVEMLEPSERHTRRAVGRDLMQGPARSEALLQAVREGGVVLSQPMALAPNEPSDNFSLFAAIYRDGFNPRDEKPLSSGDAQVALDHTEGVVFAPFRIQDFFEGAFGPPSLEKELVNFSLSSDIPPAVTYNRFRISKETVDPWMLVERPIHLYGRNFLLRVYPLPNFYSFADRFLAPFVGLGAALISCLVLMILRASQDQLELETMAKEASIEAAEQSRRQVEDLRRLNEFDRGLVGELELDSLVKKFVASLKLIGGLSGHFLFLKSGEDLMLRSEEGLGGALTVRKLSGVWAENLFTQRLLLRKGAPGADEILRSLINHHDIFSDWLLAVISTREKGRCGLLFLGREKGLFSEVDRELFESMLSQFASGLEIAQLFLRVEDASKAKNAFLANMSHEIRTPLSAIIGFSEILTKEGVSAEMKIAAADNVRRNGHQLTCIIDDILDLSKVEAGKLKVDRKATDLYGVIQEVRSQMELRAEHKGIDLSVESVGPLPLTLETDEVRLKQILVNLLGNAIKFTESGSVRLLVRHVTSGDSEECLFFTVKDSGIGISEEAKRELFRPFSQGDASSTRKYGGSGLGLALSRRLAQELGGDIQLVESIRGQGSTFELRISAGDLSAARWGKSPFAKRNSDLAKTSVNAPRLDGARILVVEDSEDNQEIFSYFLDSSGAHTKLVGNGLRAVEEAFAEPYDLILMDIQIPGIDGKEATRRIRRKGFRQPIVALTAHAMAEEQESCRKAGCDGQITKPVSGDGLVEQVAEYLRRA